MKKNVVFWIGVKNEKYSEKYGGCDWMDISRKTWEYWCEKNDVLFVPFEDTIEKDLTKFRINWQKAIFCFDELERRGIDYDQVYLVDGMNMVKWDAPNIFELYDEEFCGVSDNSNLRWLNDSLNVYGKFFPNVTIDYYEYINSGVMFFNKEHLSFFETILEFYTSNKKELDGWNKGGGCDQTIINYLLVKEGINKRLLSPDWNLLHINRKEMFRKNIFESYS